MRSFHSRISNPSCGLFRSPDDCRKIRRLVPWIYYSSLDGLRASLLLPALKTGAKLSLSSVVTNSGGITSWAGRWIRIDDCGK